MKIKEHLTLAARYLLARLQEPSTIKGLILVAAAYGWWDLDNSSKGEAWAQAGMLFVGLINAMLPQSVLYRDKEKNSGKPGNAI